MKKMVLIVSSLIIFSGSIASAEYMALLKSKGFGAYGDRFSLAQFIHEKQVAADKVTLFKTYSWGAAGRPIVDYGGSIAENNALTRFVRDNPGIIEEYRAYQKSRDEISEDEVVEGTSGS